MKLKIIGSESMGVRGLSCFIEVGNHSVLIDPGVALGFTRSALHPHPIQAAFSELSKVLLTFYWLKATDIVVTHLHGDHIPLHDANPFQFSLSIVRKLNNQALLWIKSIDNSVAYEKIRFEKLCECFHDRVVNVNEGSTSSDELIEFSGPYPHGLSKRARVMAVKIGYGSSSVVHLSDTQLLIDEVIKKVRSWRPKIVITDGPPLYRLHGALRARVAEKALVNAAKLASYADYVIIDHHVCRSLDGVRWLDSLRARIGDRVMCAADYMGRPRLLLEAWRRVMYEVIPVRNDWFILSNYRGFGEALNTYGMLITELMKQVPKEVTLSELEVRRVLRGTVSSS